MKILVVSGDPKHIPEYLQTGGHEIRECYSTDHADRMADDYRPDAVLFFSDAVVMRGVSHEEALKALVPRTRVILLAKKTDSLVGYASGLGVRDFVFLPVNPVDILHRLENPALPQDAAEMLSGMTIQKEEAPAPGGNHTSKRFGSILNSIRGAGPSRWVHGKDDGNDVDNESPDIGERMEDEAPESTLTVVNEQPLGVDDVENQHTAEQAEGLEWGDAPWDEIEQESVRQEQESVAPINEPDPKPGMKPFRGRKAELDSCNQTCYYIPHQIIAVWNPDGWAKSFTAFNLAALAVAKGFDVALVNYDLSCPELDAWFGVKQTSVGSFSDNSAGVMTFGADFNPELVARLLKKRAWGIRYLPAGNKLGNIGAPDIPEEALERTLRLVYQRETEGKPAITVVDAGRSYESTPTLAALGQAAIVLIPVDGTPGAAAVIQQQMKELHRLGRSPRFIEVLFSTPGRKAFHVCHERCSVMFDWMAYLIDRAEMRPQCLRIDGRRAWEGVLNRLIPSGKGNMFRTM